MRKTKEILRLKHELGLTNRQIASSLHLSHTCVDAYLRRARQAGIGWPIPEHFDEDQLRQLLLAAQKPPPESKRYLPPMDEVHRELRRKGVTLQLIWEEYHRTHPDGYGHTQFWEYYRRFCAQLDPALRQAHPAGERMFVDWAGLTIPLVDPQTGQSRPAHLFVAVLGASNYTFTEAFENTQLPSWIEAHVHAWEFFGGVARLTVPDNPKTAVTHACRYEPELNTSYQELAAHYGTVILPARARKPQDKAKVEAAVQHAERRILAVLRDQRFFSLAELNTAIRRELHSLNERPFQKLPGSRATLFAELDQPALQPLPATRYELALWRKAKANIDYHVQVDWHMDGDEVPYLIRAIKDRDRIRHVWAATQIGYEAINDAAPDTQGIIARVQSALEARADSVTPAVRSIGSFSMGEDDGGNLIGKRFVCRGGSLLIWGPIGAGKSSLIIQFAHCRALGQD